MLPSEQPTPMGETIAELQRLQSSLPTTADGVTVIPGMLVWYVCRVRKGSPVCWSRVYSVSSDEWSEYGGGQPHYIRDGEPYFSTELLALAYKAQQLREMADKAEAACGKVVTEDPADG